MHDVVDIDVVEIDVVEIDVVEINVVVIDAVEINVVEINVVEIKVVEINLVEIDVVAINVRIIDALISISIPGICRVRLYMQVFLSPTHVPMSRPTSHAHVFSALHPAHVSVPHKSPAHSSHFAAYVSCFCVEHMSGLSVLRHAPVDALWCNDSNATLAQRL